VLRIATVAACLLTLAGCGEGEDEQGGGGPAPPAAELTVTVRPEGPGGPVRERRVECERVGPGAGEPVCRSLSAGRLAPVPELTACTAIYGGPDVARVTGTLRGEPVDARFSLEDGCEIARWERNAALLGPHGRGP
jgi:hypothetical protein